MGIRHLYWILTGPSFAVRQALHNYSAECTHTGRRPVCPIEVVDASFSLGKLTEDPSLQGVQRKRFSNGQDTCDLRKGLLSGISALIAARDAGVYNKDGATAEYRQTNPRNK
jgi:hypothetical protein